MKTTAILIGALAALLPLAAHAQGGPAQGSKYVAMGSSFAAGPGIPPSADDPPNRCTRSQENYAHQLARKRGLNLVDVSCSGATTQHILGPWNELKAQFDAVDASTRLVTVTIGGNDVRYTAGLSAAACLTAKSQPTCPAPAAAPTAQEWEDLEGRLRQIAGEVHRRAPNARLVFVDYTTVLPPGGTCPTLSLTAEQAEASRQVNKGVVDVTARVARSTGSGLVQASALTAAHNACAAEPWVNGFPPAKGAAFHPRVEAHTAIAAAIDQALWP
jgi:lysophospholipase L1-like esterase